MLTPTAIRAKPQLKLPQRRAGLAVTVNSLMAAYSKAPPDMKIKARRAKTEGKRTKMGLCRFLFEVFRQNELLPRKEKLTNEKIAAMVIDEFPDQEKLHRGLIHGGKVSINDYRRRYNNGTLVKDVLPDRVSFRYNRDGLAVESRMGRRLLTIMDQNTISERFRQKWKSFGPTRPLDEA